MCSNGLIDNKTLLNGVGEWKTARGPIGEANFICTEFDPTADWMMGSNRIYYTSNNSNPFSIW